MNFCRKLVIFLTIFTFAFPPSVTTYAQDACERTWTQEPPFFVSEATDVGSDQFKAGRVTKAPAGMERDEVMSEERLRDLEKKGIFKPIFRGTLVRRLNNSPIQLQKIVDGEGFLVPVEVVSENDVYAKQKGTENYAKRGDVGRIWSQSIRPVDESDRLIVTRDTVLQTLYGFPVDIRGIALQPVMDEQGRYLKDCTGHYFFRSMLEGDPELQAPRNTLLMHPCNDNWGVRHISDVALMDILDMRDALSRTFEQERSIADFEFNDWGMIRFPMKKVTDREGVIGEAFDGSFIRYPTRSPEGSNDWVHPQSACKIMQLTRQFREQCLARYENKSACRLQMGNTTFITPGLLSNGRDPLGHRTHHSGTCVDFRPPTQKEFVGALTYRSRSIYSRTLTRWLVDLARDLGAEPIFFSDPQISKLRHVSDPGDHDNHVHLCFPVDESEVPGCSLLSP